MKIVNRKSERNGKDRSQLEESCVEDRGRSSGRMVDWRFLIRECS